MNDAAKSSSQSRSIQNHSPYILGWLVSLFMLLIIIVVYLNVDLSKEIVSVVFSVIISLEAFLFMLISGRYKQQHRFFMIEGKKYYLPRPYYLLPQKIRSFVQVISLFIIVNTYIVFFLFSHSIRQLGFARGLYLYVGMIVSFMVITIIFLASEEKRVRLLYPLILSYYFAALLLILSPIFWIKKMLLNQPSRENQTQSMLSKHKEEEKNSLPTLQPLTLPQKLAFIAAITIFTIIATLSLHSLPLKALLSATAYPGSPDHVYLNRPFYVSMGTLVFKITILSLLYFLADFGIMLSILVSLSLFMLYLIDDPELSYYIIRERGRLEREILKRYHGGTLSKEQLAEEVRTVQQVVMQRALKVLYNKRTNTKV